MTVLTTFTYFLCGALEMKLTGDSRKASWKNYGILSVYTYGGMAMTNYALSYLNYAPIVFKSAKIIPVWPSPSSSARSTTGRSGSPRRSSCGHRALHPR